MKDNIKIEINYSLRSHVLPTQKLYMPSHIVSECFEVNTVSPIEIYATKTVALLTRGAARDLYDMNYMVRNNLFSDEELSVYRKCVVFYLAVATETPIMTIDCKSLDNITAYKIMTDLKPVVRDRDAFKLNTAKEIVKAFIVKNIFLDENDLTFLSKFKQGDYRPELIFEDKDYLERLAAHPMALWKTCRNRARDE